MEKKFRALMMIYYLRAENRYELHPPKNSNIGNFSSFLLRFDFVDWEKSKRAHNFHPITGNVKRGRDRLMNHTSCESFALALMIKYIQYNTIWSSAAAAWSQECIIQCTHVASRPYTRLWLYSIDNASIFFLFLLVNHLQLHAVCSTLSYESCSSFDKSSKNERQKENCARLIIWFHKSKKWC